ncbi:PepSY domain-containing protein [Rhizorhabdus dicambivorans]|uniref:PepSY domain-containing protein n=1 Tax=Rhizorhabdus dicambivorans TaxID=1850238 RepID=UPI000ADDCF14|nr:PepSY domain-containing protein [Rhizorhabdus dicambivorans]
MRKPLVALLSALLFVAASPASAERNRVPEQDALRNGVRSGEYIPYQEMRARAQGRVDGQMIGSEFDPGTGRYRFKFQRGGSVIWMDMDGRTGREVGRVGQ